jgi:hypothetical protein
MGSLALVVALIMVSLWGLAAFSVLASFLGFKKVGFVLGLLSAVSGAWLLFVLPHAPALGMINIVAGVFSMIPKEKR